MNKTKLLLAMLPFIQVVNAAEETVIQEPDLLFYIVPNVTAKEAADNSAVASELALAVTRYAPVISTSTLTPGGRSFVHEQPARKAKRHPKKHRPKHKQVAATKASAPSSAAQSNIPAALSPASSAATPCVPAPQDSIFLRIPK